jgi:hypothetical protein
MPGPEYHHKQAQICARLALASTDRTMTDRYLELALDHLAKCGEADLSDDMTAQGMPGDGGSDMDRD